MAGARRAESHPAGSKGSSWGPFSSPRTGSWEGEWPEGPQEGA